MSSYPSVSFKKGCMLLPEIWDHPRLMTMVRAAVREAPALFENVMVITSVWRSGTGYHPKNRAIDIRSGLSGISRGDLKHVLRTGAIVPPVTNATSDLEWLMYLKIVDWAKKIALRLGDEYDVVYGIDRNHVNHIHIEHDERKENG